MQPKSIGKRKIVIIDGNSMMAGAIAEMVTCGGMRAYIFSQADAAIRWCIKHPRDIDTVIAEHYPPKVNGIETCRVFHSFDKTIRFVITSGCVSEACLPVGHPVYLPKPFLMRQLLRAINRARSWSCNDHKMECSEGYEPSMERFEEACEHSIRSPE